MANATGVDVSQHNSSVSIDRCLRTKDFVVIRALVGNSSSGIMETPAFALPTVNVGVRQRGRERARNVIDAAADATAIFEAVRRARSAEFRASLAWEPRS